MIDNIKGELVRRSFDFAQDDALMEDSQKFSTLNSQFSTLGMAA